MRRIPIGTTATLIGALGFAFGAAAQDPANITPGFGNGLGTSDTFEDSVFPTGTILMDQLYHVDDQTYFAGNGNCWGGYAIFGPENDLQLCDDLQVDRDFQITDVTTDGVTFFGKAPVSLRIGVFADIGDEPSNDYSFDADWPVSSSSSFTDTIFSLLGVRATASGVSDVIAAGHYWVMGQPGTADDIGGNGDWFYTPRGNQDNGDDSFGREGDRGSQWSSDWVSMGAFGYGAGDCSMQVAGILLTGDLRISLEGECPGEMTLHLSAATPGETVYFAGGFDVGETPVPGCPDLVVDIANARLVGRTTADENGSATITGFVPERFCGRLILQAVSHVDCLKSNIIEF